MNDEVKLLSVAQIAGTLGVTPARVEYAIEKLDIQASWRHPNLKLYDAAVVGAIRDRMKKTHPPPADPNPNLN